MMKPVLVGLTNPHSRDPLRALFKEGTGRKIFSMLSSVNGSITEEDYGKTFDRRNLTTNSDVTREMLRTLAEKMRFEPGTTVVLLGRDVQKAFGRRQDGWLLAFFDEERQIYWRSIPHPSGRCRFYNDPVNKRLVAILLNDLYLEGR